MKTVSSFHLIIFFLSTILLSNPVLTEVHEQSQSFSCKQNENNQCRIIITATDKSDEVSVGVKNCGELGQTFKKEKIFEIQSKTLNKNLVHQSKNDALILDVTKLNGYREITLLMISNVSHSYNFTCEQGQWQWFLERFKKD